MITIRHTHEDGTMLEGSSKGDGVYEIVKRHGFAYFPSIRAIGIRGSRDRVANRYRINTAADALRAAGHEVTVDIDDTLRDRATVLADQAQRLDERRDALEAKAARHGRAAEAHFEAADRLAGARNGQPILIGHYSERRARADQARIERNMDASCREHAIAKDAAQRADAVGSAAAYSATPGVTARRIERAEAELRRVQRDLDGYRRQFRNGRGEVYVVDTHEPADGQWREQLLARKAQLEQQLDYDRQALAAAAAEGRHVVWGKDTVHVGDLVNFGLGTWRRVVKVNKVTVSVETGYSWTDKIRYTDIRQVKCLCAVSEGGEG